MTAKYWIAQYVQDLFRQEPRNIGVFVEMDGQKDVQFIGEGEDGQIDGRRLRLFQYPDAYREWVGYWRRRAAEAGTGIDELVAASGSHFRVIEGGELSDVGEDSLQDATGYLYSLLVDGGFSGALSAEAEKSEEKEFRRLEDDISQVFKEMQILGNEGSMWGVKHPIRRGYRVPGKVAKLHKPAFSQQNGRLYIMESVDFTGTQKKRATEHASYSAYMFGDVRAEDHNAVPIAIVKATDEDKENEDVGNALDILRGEAIDVVDWLDEEQRDGFIRERKRIAEMDADE